MASVLEAEEGRAQCHHRNDDGRLRMDSAESKHREDVMSEEGNTLEDATEKAAIFDHLCFSHRLMDDVDLMQQVAENFILDIPSQLEHLQQAILDNDVAAMSHLAHKVRGAAANMAAEEMAACALKLEKAAKSGEVVAPQKMMDELSEAYKRLVHVLSTIFQR